jgi:hypothetical protein
MSECGECYKSTEELKNILLSLFDKYNLIKDIKENIFNYIFFPCKCSYKNCCICIDCFYKNKRSQNDICLTCEEHCCQTCYHFEYEDYNIFYCLKCKKLICLTNCVAVTWCQANQCLCKKCIKEEEDPVCNKCNTKYKNYPIVEDTEIFCQTCSTHTSSKTLRPIWNYLYIEDEK